jgi:beta-glucanase (GH16 family)
MMLSLCYIEENLPKPILEAHPYDRVREKESISMIKKMIVIMTVGILLLHSAWQAPPANADPFVAGGAFTDTSDHWAEEAIDKLFEAGVIKGYKDGSFRSNTATTRAEFVVQLQRVLGWKVIGAPSVFKDVVSGSWHTDAVLAAAAEGIIFGGTDGNFGPSELLTREQMAVILVRVFGSELGKQEAMAKESLSKFSDYRTISAYALASMAALVDDNTMKGYLDGTLRPGKAVTRAESAALLNQLAGTIYSKPGEFLEVGKKKNITVSVSGVKLKDVIAENLRLAAGIEDGDVVVSDAVVSGHTIVIGGGTSSVYFKTSTLNELRVEKRGNPVRIVLESGTKVSRARVFSSSILETKDNSRFTNVETAGETTEAGRSLTLKGQFDAVTLTHPGLRVTIDKVSVIKSLSVAAKGIIINDQPVPIGSVLQFGQSGLNVSVPGGSSGTGGSGNQDGSNVSPPGGSGGGDNDVKEKKWNLVWSDDFNTDTIDESKWNLIEGGGGFGNEELQHYTKRNENTRIEEGKLILEANKENFGGNEYTSGKLTTEGKGEWTYGRYEIRAKLPQGQGIWPAIWMMPVDERMYSSWPNSGEIDIMEMLGHDPGQIHGTLHYGQPHSQSQESYRLPDGKSFAEDYHVFALEWEPGEIRHYVDGIQFSKMNDWYTRDMNEAMEYTYPAPFDRDFYLQLNLAVGGTWPGNPDETTSFTQKMAIDYVNVYTLDGGYKDAGERPSEGELREPDETGNYIVNGKFDENISPWVFQPFGPPANLFGGEAELTLDGGTAKTTITAQGKETYAVQFVQTKLPLQKGATYSLSFDAWSDAERSMMVSLTGHTRGYIRYMGEDRLVSLNAHNSGSNSYQYEFVMNENTDGDSRLEFNMGKSGTSPVWIDNVRLIKIADPDPNPPKVALPNGGLVYNGTFDQGSGRMAFWSLEEQSSAKAEASVIERKLNGRILRELQLNIMQGGDSPDSVKWIQDRLTLESGVHYSLLFDARTDDPRTMRVRLGNSGSVVGFEGKEAIELTSVMDRYELEFTLDEPINDAKLEFLVGGATGKVILDNVQIVKRGVAHSIDGYTKIETDEYWGMSGIQVGGDGSVGYLEEGDSIEYKLLVGKAGLYHLTARLASEEPASYLRYEVLNAKKERLYTGTMPVGNTGGWGIYQNFKLPELNLATGVHYLIFTGSKYNSDWLEFVPDLIGGGFNEGLEGWDLFKVDGIPEVEPTKVEWVNGSAVIDIADPGSEEWHIQFKRERLELKQGRSYKLSFTASSTVERDIKALLQKNGGDYKVYNKEETIQLTTTPQQFESVFTMTAATDPEAVLQFSLGKIGDVVGAHTITIDKVSLMETIVETPIADQPIGVNLLENGDFDNGMDNWTFYSPDSDQLGIEVVAGKLEITLVTSGANSWDRQVYLPKIDYRQGYNYTLKFKAKSSKPSRKMNVSLGWLDEANNYFWNGYHSKILDLTNAEEQHVIDFSVDTAGTDIGRITLELGNIQDGNAEDLFVTLDDFELINNGPVKTIK